jgi:hypothetical protein
MERELHFFWTNPKESIVLASDQVKTQKQSRESSNYNIWCAPANGFESIHNIITVLMLPLAFQRINLLCLGCHNPLIELIK